MARHTDITRRDESSLWRSDPVNSPFRMMERLTDQMDRLFGDLGFGRNWATSRYGRYDPESASQREWYWTPEIDMFHRHSELVVRADLPGMSKDDVKVDVTEDRVTIQGERKHEREEEGEGAYRSERSYGTFYREIPLPAGTISDQAKATFKDGVLEIVMPAPPEAARRGRRLEIGDASTSSKR